MIDWHSHILPAMDDGSRSVAEGLSLVAALSDQGVDTVVATPHFYANDEGVQQFLSRRKQCFDLLREQLTPDGPRILLGAEVRYYPGIGRLADLKGLCIEGSNLLLLEMPFERWTEYTVREVIELAGSGGVTVVLAHIERYLRLQSGDVWQRLIDGGVLMQVNAGFFCGPLSRRRALRLLTRGRIHLIGSDCHNMTSRPPRLGKAFMIIEKKLGGHFASQMHEYGQSLLVQNNSKIFN